MESNWKEEAAGLFFDGKRSITEIEKALGISRKTLSAYLRGCPGYDEERQQRKRANARKRPEYKRQWDRENRPYGGAVTQETIRREHDLAVLELSRERYR